MPWIAPLRPGYAFTLIELLVVVGVIAAPLAILLPAFFAARERGRTPTAFSPSAQRPRTGQWLRPAGKRG